MLAEIQSWVNSFTKGNKAYKKKERVALAQAWLDAGFTAEDVRLWGSAGCATNPQAARALGDAGLDPTTVSIMGWLPMGKFCEGKISLEECLRQLM